VSETTADFKYLHVYWQFGKGEGLIFFRVLTDTFCNYYYILTTICCKNAKSVLNHF